MQFILRFLLVLIAASMLGCAVGQAPYAPPVDIPLHEAPPGKAVVYLIRIPYDRLTVSVAVNGIQAAVLPPSTYTALILNSGRQVIATTPADGDQVATLIAPEYVLDLKEGQRTMLYLSGKTDQATNQTIVTMAGKMPIVTGPVSRRPISGGWQWKLASELDAQGLMSIAKVVLPVLAPTRN